MAQIGVIIVAAGSARRMAGKDKIFAALQGKPLLAWSVEACQGCDLVDKMAIVLKKDDLEKGRKLKEARGWFKVAGVCAGGERRQDSVKNGLQAMGECDWVIIHDGARPFLSVALIKDGLEAARETGSAIAAVPVKDTIKMVDENMLILKTLERGQLWMAQTPQVFRWQIIKAAYNQVAEEVTDDAALVERLGYQVKIYRGDYDNIKVTTPEDLTVAEMIAGSRL